MADMNEKLTIHDQALVNAMNFIVLVRVPDREKQKMMLGVIEDLLNDVNRDHFYMSPIADCAERLVDADHGSGELWSWAVFEAARAMAVFAEWRTGLALEARNQAERTAA